MIRTLNAAFLNAVANHPDVRPWLGGEGELDLSPLVSDDRNISLINGFGGFVFRNADGFGFVRELHSMFLPDGWGRAVADAAREAVEYVFGSGCQLIFTWEQSGHWRSRPPKTHGWKRASDDFRPSGMGDLRVWFLTPEMWRNSPINKGKH